MHARRLVGSFCMLVAVVAFAGGCGENGGGDGGDGGAPATAEEAEAQIKDVFAESVCTAAYQCPEEQPPGLVTFASRYGDQSTCEDEFLAELGVEGEFDFASNVDRGLSEYNADKTQECLDAIRSRIQDDPCNAFFEGTGEAEACEEIVTGTQPNGGACSQDLHCSSGYCDTDIDVGDACWSGECGEDPGTTTVGAGEDCLEENTVCEDGYVCDTSANGQGRVCVEVGSRGEGENCNESIVCSEDLACADGMCASITYNGEGGECDLQSTNCEPGLICSFETFGEAGSCTTPKGEDADCLTSFSCQPDLYCQRAEGETSGTCKPRLAEGEECAEDFDCQPSLFCSEGGTCSAPEAGETCEIPTEGS